MAEISEDELRNFVRQYLIEFKALIYENGFQVTNRQINKQQLIELGLTAKDREEIVLTLSVLDYSSGPIKDEYKPGDYWVFGKHIDDVEVYIKIKIAGNRDTEHAVCFLFHKSEYPLSYPIANI